ncbi:DUF6333 family protein [Streptomyces sp. NPDC051180]|uniref:DUF6333 family protein n=1 Tax=Streptomyces sp. NPDC051180 TaxID=3155797 RepID=UPI00344EC529
MTHTEFWTSPPDRVVQGSGTFTITILEPPFDVAATELPPHDPVRARRFAEEFPTVDAVLGELPGRPAGESPYLETRADLELIRVGCWGNVTAVSDPAFVDNGNDEPLLALTEELQRRYPHARIVGRAEVDCGEAHTEDVIRLPGGPLFHASGWPTMDPWKLTGDPHALVEALGVPAGVLEDLDLDLDEEPEDVEWKALVALGLGRADPWAWPHLQTSVFRVRHTEAYTLTMEELWFIGG